MPKPGNNPYGIDAPPVPSTPTRPCPGCGHPADVAATLCVRCGHMMESGKQASTRSGTDRLPPPPPRFQVHAINPDSGLRPFRKPMVMLTVSLLATLAWKFGMDGPAESLAYLTRYAITLPIAIGILALACLLFVDYSAPLLLTALSIAAALACADLIQHGLHYTLIPTLAWVAAFVVYCGCIADLLELDMPDAVFVGLATYFAKLVLKWTLFASMFPPPSA
ncbi:MAG: hypothetical protein ACKVW3_04015 [Phycisphaerales bacterium]